MLMGGVTSLDQSNRSGLLSGRLRAARNAVSRLDHVEGRLARIAGPYSARVVARIVDLHAAGQSQYVHWRALLERHGIQLRRTAVSPLQGATRIVFEHGPWGTVAMYACAAAWVWDRLRRGLIQPDEIEAIVVREGGVAAVAKAYRRQHGSGRAGPKASRAIYETTLASMPRAGFVLGEAAKHLPDSDLLAVIRRDARGRRYVVALELPETRVRELIVRVTRDARHSGKVTKTG
jgi:hypothetical protein